MIKIFEIYNREQQLKPIKVWLDGPEQLDSKCLEQALNLANLPFIHQWVVLMPDTHSGFGMPIGGVIGCQGHLIPNAVGVDIGCGVTFVATDSKVQSLKGHKEKPLEQITKQILREIPTGFEHHKNRQSSQVLDNFQVTSLDQELNKPLVSQISKGYFQIGTLGGGNHFIELQEDEGGYLCIMVHSGSRNFGKQVCDFFNHLAKEQNKKSNYPLPAHFDLAPLMVETKEGRQYIKWMNLALNFAQENRRVLMERVKAIVADKAPEAINFEQALDCHHNFAAEEEHFGAKVWVHRKGAIRAFRGQRGIVPGSMGSYSYLVEGLGNEDSFSSSPHGAGRIMGRNEAKRTFSVEEVMVDLEKREVVLGKKNKKDIAEEARFVYKDIEQVVDQGSSLFKPLKKLKTIAVVKG